LSVVQRVGKKDGITCTGGLVSLLLRDGFNTISVRLLSNDGKGGRRVWGVDENGESTNGYGLGVFAVPRHLIFGFRDPPDTRRRGKNIEDVLSCSERGEKQREKKCFK